MNLWDRRMGLTFLSALLIFFGCEDPLSNLGFRNPNQKFDVRFVEIDVPTSLILVDSVPTAHDYTPQFQDIFRLMVGSFNNPVFGNTETKAYTQFRPGMFGTTFNESAVLDSVVLKVKLDFYTTGNNASGNIKVNIYEITEELDLDLKYYSNSSVTYDPVLLGQAELSIQPDIYNAFLEAKFDTVIHLKALMNENFGQRLFESAIINDSTFNQYQYFRKKFKGLVLVSENAEHVIGLSVANPDTRMEMHYHDDSDTLRFDFYFDSVVGFSTISTDRGGTALSGLNNFYSDFTPADNMMYVQGGTGIITKLDFSKFLEFTDTIPNIQLNSVELVINNIEAAQNMRAPNELMLKVLRNNNRFRSIENKQDSAAIRLYRLSLLSGSQQHDRVWYDFDFSFLVGGDNFNKAVLNKKDNNSYRTFITLFLQRLLEIESPEKQFKHVGVFVSDPIFGKSLDSFSFPRDNVKLRVYYTKPINR